MEILGPAASLLATALAKGKLNKSSDYFSAEDLRDITFAVQRAEENTSGEIRVRIIRGYDPDLKNDPRALYLQAVRDFRKEGMHNTSARTGVLVLLVLNEKKFTIFADSGIHEALPQEYWEELAETLAFHFKIGSPARAISLVVEDIGEKLAEFFPRKADDVNELSDAVSVGE